jgi:hypothetical protein
MNKESEHKIYSATECVSEKMMFDYIDQRLNPRESHLVEKHMLDCEFCSDALEGLQLLKNRNKIALINEAVDVRLAGETKIVFFNFKTVFAIAAAIALLVMGVFFFNQFSDKKMMESDMAELKEDLSPPPPPPGDAFRTIDEVTGGAKTVENEIKEPEMEDKKGLLESPRVSDEELAFAEKVSPGYYKNTGAQDDRKQPMSPESTVNGTYELDQTIAQSDKITTVTQSPAELSNKPGGDYDKEKDVKYDLSKKAEEQGAGATTYTWSSTNATNATTSSAPDQNLEGNNKAVAKDNQNQSGPGKKEDKSGKYRSEVKTADKEKTKSAAGKETRADEDIVVTGTVAYEPQSITKEKEELKAQVTTKSLADSVAADYIYTIAETMPEYPGGDVAMMKFMRDNLSFPSALKDQIGVQPTKIYVQFTVGKDSIVRNAKVVKGISPSFDKEALRVVNLMPKWKPGTQKGKAVSVLYNLPIQLEIK